MGGNVFISPTIRSGPGGSVFVNPGVVILNMYTLTSTAIGAGAFTLPDSTTSFTTRAFGAGGSGGGPAFNGLKQQQIYPGGGAGGGGQGIAVFTKTTAGSQTFTTSVPVTTAATSSILAGNTGANCTITANSTAICTGGGGILGGVGVFIFNGQATPGAGGAGGTGSSADLTGWTRVDGSISGSPGITGSVVTSGPSENLQTFGGTGGNVGGFGTAPLTGTQGQGGPGVSGGAGGGGNVPGGGGAGGGGIFQMGTKFFEATGFAGGTGAAGRVVIQVIAKEGLLAGDFSLTGFSFADNGPI